MSNIPRLERKETHSSLLEWFWCGLVAVGNWAQVVVIDLLVAQTRHATLAEVHDVLGERARLVGEEELDLAELLVDVRRVRLGRLVDVRVVHLEVPLEEELAAELHQLCKSKSHNIHNMCGPVHNDTCTHIHAAACDLNF